MTAILALDASTGPCSAAVWKDGRVAAYLMHAGPEAQSAALLPLAGRALAQCGLGYRDLSAVAATIGPGSFTGIRVGLAAARGIAFAAGIKGLGFSTLDVLAFAAQDGDAPILAALNAGKGEVYFCLYDAKAQPLGQAMLGPPQEAQALAASRQARVTGNTPLSEAPVFPRADALARLAALGAGAEMLAPFYLRPPDAKLPAAAP